MEKIIKAPIDTVNLPEELKTIFLKAGFKTLEQVLDRKTNFLLKIDGFGYRQLKNFLDYLENNHIDHLLKDK
jgi:DNA-directed RNA polymerase alpha subunit